ncbi:MAG TPA: hypothetical protein VFU16_01155 [Solirubrobacterales bacterium]|nr:hypothetical protein [Solirubrobacterales bacterium]
MLAFLLWPAVALRVDGDREVTFAIPLKADHGLSVKLEADDDEVQLTVGKRGQQTTYFARGEVARVLHPLWECAYTYFLASSSEVTEGIGISRYTFAGTRSAGFEFDHRRRTASVDPPAPFGGTARFPRRPGRPARWTGSLTAPLLGLGRVRLAGPGFAAKMEPGLPEVN